MKKVDYLVIGGGAAGTTAAEVVRSLVPNATITIVSGEDHEEYSRVLLPHYTRGRIAREQVFLKKPEWYKDKRIGIVKGKRAKSLDAGKKMVTIGDGEQIEYGKLLLAVGGEAVRLTVPGSDSESVIYMRTIEDGDAIVKYAASAKKALIVGGGFVSLDLATSFRARGVDDITILVKEPYFWSGKLDEDSSRVLQEVLRKNGIKVIVNEETAEISARGGAGVLVTKSGKRFEFDVVGVGIGIKSSLDWLAGTGLKIDKAIVTNEYLETSLPDVFAAGDCAQFHDVVFDTDHVVGNWANATSQGAAVGKTMAGNRTLYETTSSYSDTFFEGSYCFIGVTKPDFADEVITRGLVEEGKMTKIFVKTFGSKRRIVGATIINHQKEVAILTSAIKSKTDVKDYGEKLGDINIPLSEILTS